MVYVRVSLNSQHVKPLSGWVTAAGEHTGFHWSGNGRGILQLPLGTGVYLTKWPLSVQITENPISKAKS